MQIVLCLPTRTVRSYAPQTGGGAREFGVRGYIRSGRSSLRSTVGSQPGMFQRKIEYYTYSNAKSVESDWRLGPRVLHGSSGDAADVEYGCASAQSSRAIFIRDSLTETHPLLHHLKHSRSFAPASHQLSPSYHSAPHHSQRPSHQAPPSSHPPQAATASHALP